VPRVLLALALAAFLAGVAQGASAPALVIQGDRVVGGVRILSGRPALERRFGGPDSARRQSAYECALVWRTLGLTATLLDLSRQAPCRAGAFVRATVTGRSWRTAKGLRVGSTVVRLRRLYPRARHDTSYLPWSGWWLVTRRACAEVGGSPYPGLLGRTRGGRVSALVVAVAACE
jgi:hypothetical protein